MSQEANDNVCLQHALSWLYCLTLTNTDKLIEHSILKSLELSLSYTMSFGMLCFVQYAGVTSGNPKQIFEVTIPTLPTTISPNIIIYFRQ